MDEETKKSLEIIDGQLTQLNARNISMRWIGMRKTPTFDEIIDLNRMISFIIREIRTLRKTGKLDVDAEHKKEFPELYNE